MESGRFAIPPVPLANVERITAPIAGRFSFCPSPRKVCAKPKIEEVPEVTPVEVAEAAPAETKEKSKIQILEDTTDPNYEPTQAEIEEYAVWLGMNMETDKHLFWIARAGLKAPCKEPWKPCKTEEGDLFYFNFSTGESIWDHPADIYYKTLYRKQKLQSSTGASIVPSLKLPHHVEEAVSSIFRSPRKITARKSGRLKESTETLPESETNKHGKITVLECDTNYEPSEEEVLEYAVWLGMNLEDDKDLLWIAWSGLREPCPSPWKPCQTEAGDIFFFNFSTGESIWDHPRDQHFRDLLVEHKAQKSGESA
mmetsp:Transcript_75934/g.143151  ORF Transcript_75934/g.143151 Transcript_75934/m.143151 type:complete len:311 (-) Transcript_75934:31-963(-)